MLRHMLDKHEGVNMSNIKWDMFTKEYKRNAFERQIEEAVTIEREMRKSEILNSKSEWNQCSFPRLVTRMGKTDDEIKNLEQELEEERKVEEMIEEKAEGKREKIREKVRHRQLENKIKSKLEKLPYRERKKIETEEDIKKRRELQETKHNLWKLRSREKKYSKKTDKLVKLEIEENLKKKLRTIEKNTRRPT